MVSIAAFVPKDFSQTVSELFAAGDSGRMETMLLLFGPEQLVQQDSGRAVPQLTQYVVPEQNGTECTVEMTPAAETAALNWATEQNLVMYGWAHSHHIMTTIPSRADIKVQWGYQKMKPEFLMVIKNIRDGIKVYQLSAEAMTQLTPTHGEVAEGVDTTTLIEEYKWEVDAGLPPVQVFGSGVSLPLLVQTVRAQEAQIRQILRMTQRILRMLLRSESGSPDDEVKVALPAPSPILPATVLPVIRPAPVLPAPPPIGAPAEAKAGKAPGRQRRPKMIGQPKQPPSAFMLFLQSIRGSKLSGQSCSAQAKEGSKLWKKLPANEQQQFREEADSKKRKYHEDMSTFKKGQGLRVLPPGGRPGPPLIGRMMI